MMGVSKLSGVGKGNGHAEAFTLRNPVGGRQEIEAEFHRLPCRDCLELAFEMIVPRQAEILKRGLSQCSMRGPEIPFGHIGRISFVIHLFKIHEQVQIRCIRAQPDMHNRVPEDLHG